MNINSYGVDVDIIKPGDKVLVPHTEPGWFEVGITGEPLTVRTPSGLFTYSSAEVRGYWPQGGWKPPPERNEFGVHWADLKVGSRVDISGAGALRTVTRKACLGWQPVVFYDKGFEHFNTVVGIRSDLEQDMQDKADDFEHLETASTDCPIFVASTTKAVKVGNCAFTVEVAETAEGRQILLKPEDGPIPITRSVIEWLEREAGFVVETDEAEAAHGEATHGEAAHGESDKQALAVFKEVILEAHERIDEAGVEKGHSLSDRICSLVGRHHHAQCPGGGAPQALLGATLPDPRGRARS
jgi:hypothetical protein